MNWSLLLTEKSQRSLHSLVLLSQLPRKHHEAPERRPPRVKLRPLEGWAEERRLPRVKLRLAQLRQQAAQLENWLKRRLPRLEHLPELVHLQAEAWDHAAEGASQ